MVAQPLPGLYEPAIQGQECVDHRRGAGNSHSVRKRGRARRCRRYDRRVRHGRNASWRRLPARRRRQRIRLEHHDEIGRSANGAICIVVANAGINGGTAGLFEQVKADWAVAGAIAAESSYEYVIGDCFSIGCSNFSEFELQVEPLSDTRGSIGDWKHPPNKRSRSGLCGVYFAQIIIDRRERGCVKRAVFACGIRNDSNDARRAK
jgi:hypothetical protein